MSDNAKLEKPTQSQADTKVARRASAEAPVGQGLREGAGYHAVLAERAQAIESIRYRLTRGASGTPPAGHIAAERRAVIGAAAARIMRKQSDSVTGGEIPRTTGAPASRGYEGEDGAEARRRPEEEAGAIGDHVRAKRHDHASARRGDDEAQPGRAHAAKIGSKLDASLKIFLADDKNAASIKEKAIGEIQAKAATFGNMRCVECADAVKVIAKKAGIKGKIVRLTNKPGNKSGFVYCISKSMNVSTSNFHVGVEIAGIVYCNIHPEGLARAAWIDDFAHMHYPAGGTAAFDVSEVTF